MIHMNIILVVIQFLDESNQSFPNKTKGSSQYDTERQRRSQQRKSFLQGMNSFTGLVGTFSYHRQLAKPSLIAYFCSYNKNAFLYSPSENGTCSNPSPLIHNEWGLPPRSRQRGISPFSGSYRNVVCFKAPSYKGGDMHDDLWLLFSRPSRQQYHPAISNIIAISLNWFVLKLWLWLLYFRIESI